MRRPHLPQHQVFDRHRGGHLAPLYVDTVKHRTDCVHNLTPFSVQYTVCTDCMVFLVMGCGKLK